MRRSPLVTLLLLVGFAVISVTVWNLSGCSKGGKGDKSETGPEGITLELAASLSQAQVFRNIELTATLKNAYSMPIADERVVFWLISKTESKGMATPLYGASSDTYIPRGPSIVDRQRALSRQRALARDEFGSSTRRPTSLNPAGISPTGRTDVGRPSVVDGVRSAPQIAPRLAAPPVVPLAQADVTLDMCIPGTAFADVATDSMGIASVVVTSETLTHYVISARYGDGTESNQLSIRFVPNPSYRCSLSLTADKTVSYTGTENLVTITARLVYSEEPVVGQELTFTASTTTGGQAEEVNFLTGSVGTTNSSGEVVIEIYADDVGTFNICVDCGDFTCPSGTPTDMSGACRYIDFKTNICELELTIEPNTVQADGEEEITATAVLTMNSAPLVNEQIVFSLEPETPLTETETVYFTATGNGDDYSLYTDEAGSRVVKIRSYGYADVCTVTATMADECEGSDDKASDSRLVTFRSNECIFILTVDRASALSDGEVASQIEVTGTLTFNGEPDPSERVELSLLVEGTAETPFPTGYFALNGADSIALITDENGQVKVKFGSETAGECTVHGKVVDPTCPGMEGDLEDDVSVTFNENQCEMTVTAVPSVASSLKQPVLVSAVVTINGNPTPPGFGVNFSAIFAEPQLDGKIIFESTGGENAKAYTDENGVASAVVMSDGYVGPCKIQADSEDNCPGSDDSVDGFVNITFKPNECRIVIEPDKSTVKADNTDFATLTMGLNTNGEHFVEAGIAIRLSTDMVQATFAESDSETVVVHTGADGLATATLKSDGGVGQCNINARTETYTCPGSDDAIEGSTALTFQTNVCVLTVNVPASAKADGKDVTATATITINGEPVDASIEVVFEASLYGVVFTSGETVYTNQSGVATATFKSPGYSGLCTITARTTNDYPCPGTTDPIEGSADIIFDENDCVLQLTIDPMVAKADNSEVSALAVLTMNGEPVAGEEITFTANLTGVTFSKSQTSNVTEVTDVLGQALVKFYSEHSTGDCSIMAVTTSYECPGTETRPSATETMKFEPEDYSIELTAVSDDPNSSDGSSAAADGLREIQLRAVLTDKNGQPVGGANVTFGCENGCIERYGSPVVTNAQGVATTRMWTSVMLSRDTAGSEEDVSIWADYVGPTGTHRQSISYRFRKIRVASVFADDWSILEDGTVETTFGAYVMCSDNRPVAGVAVELASLLGIFPASGENYMTTATDNQGKASSTIVGHCLHGESTESARVVQRYCDFGNMNDIEPPAFWTQKHMTFEEGGAGCYELKFSEYIAGEVCFKSLTEDEGDDCQEAPYEDQCVADVWVCLTRKSDGSPVIGKRVDLYIHSFTNTGAIAFFNRNQNLQIVSGTTDSDGCVNAYLDATGGGRVILRAHTVGFGTITADMSVVFGGQFCTRVTTSSSSVKVGESVKFTVWGGCSKSYHWGIKDGKGGIPKSGILGEYEDFEIFWTEEGDYVICVCDEYDDCVSAFVAVAAEEEPEESPTPTPGGRSGLTRGLAKPKPTPAPGKE